MPMIHAGSIAEDLAAWVLDSIGGVIDLSGLGISLDIYDPTTGTTVLANAGTVTGSTGTGDGDSDPDNPNIDVVWHVDVGYLAANNRYRIRATSLIAGRPLIRTWPFVIRPGAIYFDENPIIIAAARTALGPCVGCAADVTGGTETLYTVTNLNPYGPGSLHQALTTVGSLYIRFEPGLTGTITHGSVTQVRPNKTIDGTGADITLSGAGFRVWGTDHPGETSNIVFAYLTFDDATSATSDDAISISEGADLIWVTHCTFTDGSDGLIDASLFTSDPGHTTRLTVSDCWFGPHPGPINIAAGHIDGKSMLIGCTAAYTGAVTDERILATVYRCVYDGAVDRNPSVFSTGRCDFVNNLVKRWGKADGTGSVGSQVFGYGHFHARGCVYEPYNDGDTHVNGGLVTLADKEAIKTTTNTTNGVNNSNAKAVATDVLLLNGATVVEQNTSQIFAPPYTLAAAAASTTLRDELLTTAGNVQ